VAFTGVIGGNLAGRGDAHMFGGIKYRTEVTVEVHAILISVPELKSLIRPLKDRINEFRKAKTPEM